MKRLVAFLFVMLMVAGVQAQLTTILSDDFEAYATNAELTTIGPWSVNTLVPGLSTAQAHSGTQSMGDYGTVQYVLNKTNLSPLLDSSVSPITVSYWLYDSNGTGGGATNGRCGLSFGTAAGNYMFVGAYHATSTSVYAVRAMDGGLGWQPTTAPRSVGWHKFTMVLYNGTINFYHNDGETPIYTSIYNTMAGWGAFIRFGSPAGGPYNNAHYDDLLIQTGFAPDYSVKINEVSWDDPGDDNEEFIELFGPGGKDLTSFTLELYNGNNGLLYPPTFALTSIPADGYLVIGNPTVPNVDIVYDGGTAGFFQNGSPDALVLKDAHGNIIDALAYECANGTGPLPAFTWEGDPFIADAVATGVGASDYSVARSRDGLDTDNNDRDFVIIPTTPGFTNQTDRGILPTYQNLCDDAAGTAYSVAWWGAFVDPTATVPGGSGLPPVSSPQGGNFACIADTGGGGNVVVFMDRATTDVSFDAYVYLSPTLPTALADVEQWNIVLRGKADNGVSTRMKSSGVMWKFVRDDEASTLTLVEALGGVETVHMALPIYGSSNTGWQRLRLDVHGNTVMGVVGGTVGSVSGNQKYVGTLTKGIAIGGIGIAYREVISNNTQCAWLSIDDINIKTNPGDVVPVELSIYNLE